VTLPLLGDLRRSFLTFKLDESRRRLIALADGALRPRWLWRTTPRI